MDDSFIRIRIDSDMRRLLDRLRDERDIHVSRWVRRQVKNALDREFHDDVTVESSKETSVATTVAPETEPSPTPTIGTQEVPDPNLETTENPKKPPIATTDTREHEPPTIGTSDVTEPNQAATETQKRPPIDGWKPRRLDSGEWGAVLDGEKVAELPDSNQLPGTAISVTDNKGDSWTTTIVAVVNRSDADILVTNAGRPRD